MRKRVPILLTALAVGGSVLLAPASASAAVPDLTTVWYPERGTPVGMTVDDVHRQVHVSLTGPDYIVTIGFDGKVVRRVTGVVAPGELVMSDDAATIYAIERDTPSLGLIDALSGAVDRVALPATWCPTSLTVTGGKVWFARRTCGSPDEGGLGVYDPATGEVTDAGVSIDPGRVRALPSRPDRLVTMSEKEGGELRVYDVSGAAPAQVAATARGKCFSAAFLSGGDIVVVACRSGDATGYRTSDLVKVGTAGGMGSEAVAADGVYLAVDAWDGAVSWDTSNGLPGERVRVLETHPVPDGLRYTADGVVVSATDRSLFFHRAARKYTTEISVRVPAVIDHGKEVRLEGTLSGGPDRETTLAVSRHDSHSTMELELPPVTTDASGRFAFTDDLGTLAGVMYYRLVFAGDAERVSSVAAAFTIVRVVPFDFNGDGMAEAVVGAPGQDTESVADTGQFTVFPGGTNGIGTAGALFDHAGSIGEPGDRFGSSFASGDFDADGFADLLVSAPGRDSGGFTDNGAVILVYGSADGIGRRKEFLTHPGKGARFGHSLAAGDFDGDGIDDAVIGAPGDGAGKILYFGGHAAGIGLDTTARRVIDQESVGVPGTNTAGDRFGWALAAGDVNGDGKSDLAVGAPSDTEDKGWSTGSVTLFTGNNAGEFFWAGPRITKDTPGVPGAAGPRNAATGDGADEFGLKLAMGDFNGDRKADLAVSAPGSHVRDSTGKDRADAGTVTVLYSDGTQISPTGSVQITQLSGAVFGGPGDNDFFGDTIAAGDANGDGVDELAMFSYGDDRLWVTPGAASGVNLAATTTWNQDTPGIPGSAEAGDKWGASLRFITGPKPVLLVGAPGEDSQQGAFTVVYGGPGGLTATGAKYIAEGTAGVPGDPENGDAFGTF